MIRPKTRAMVVLSGGQDSTTCLYWAKREYDEVHAITFDYGQRHRREIIAARHIATRAEVLSHDIVVVGDLLKSTSPLTDPAAPLETYPDYASMDKTIGDRVELTFVPMRNQFFLTLAANRAIARGISTLVTGVCEADNANYPDCRAVFIELLEAAINASLGIDRFRIETPLLRYTKAATVDLATHLPGCMEALAESHTCYAGVFPPCGACHACVLRAEGFRAAGIADPLLVRTSQSEACAL